MILPIYILRYIYGGAFAFDETIAITYVDYTDMVARWDVTIDATPPTLIDYTAVETRIADAYTVFLDTKTFLEGFLDYNTYSINVGVVNSDNLSNFTEALQKQKTYSLYLTSEENFYYQFTVDGESAFVLNAVYFAGFTNYTDLVSEFNVSNYEKILTYGYEWLYTVGQSLGETFTLVEAREMLRQIYINEIYDISFPSLSDNDNGVVIDVATNVPPSTPPEPSDKGAIYVNYDGTWYWDYVNTRWAIDKEFPMKTHSGLLLNSPEAYEYKLFKLHELQIGDTSLNIRIPLYTGNAYFAYKWRVEIFCFDNVIGSEDYTMNIDSGHVVKNGTNAITYTVHSNLESGFPSVTYNGYISDGIEITLAVSAPATVLNLVFGIHLDIYNEIPNLSSLSITSS